MPDARYSNELAESEAFRTDRLLKGSQNPSVSPDHPALSGCQLGPAASAIYAEINAATSVEQLDGIGTRLWPLWSASQIPDDEAEFLSGAIEGRRPNAGARARAAGARVEPPRLNTRIGSHFPPRQRPRSPDRQASRDRRRRLGGSSALPDTLRHHYTEGQRAVLCIIAGEVKARGGCALPIDKIAALAGVCRTTVQTALQVARSLGHLKITARPVAGRKNLPNLVEITSPEWRMWIERGSPAHRPIGSNPANSVAPTKNPNTYKGSVERDRSRSEGLARGGSGQRSPSPMNEARCG